MPIEASSPGAALRLFGDSLNGVLNRTLTRTRLVPVLVEETMTLSFRQRGSVTTASLDTRFGPMGLFLGQICRAFPIDRARFRLATAAYRYTLTPEGAEEPLFRWEYTRDWPHPEARWCRHHLQGDIRIQVGSEEVHLNDLHLPTGYVTVEEIIRFCLSDLETAPLSGDWHTHLEDSYRQFKEEFAT